MYYVDFYVGTDVVATVSHTEKDEQLWLAAGLDLMNVTSLPTKQFATDVWYSAEALKGSPDYYVTIYGSETYDSVLHFLDRLYGEAGENLYGTTEVRW